MMKVMRIWMIMLMKMMMDDDIVKDVDIDINDSKCSNRSKDKPTNPSTDSPGRREDSLSIMPML